MVEEKLSATFLGYERGGPIMADLDSDKRKIIRNFFKPRKRGSFNGTPR
jgi:hypothetical protein